VHTRDTTPNNSCTMGLPSALSAVWAGGLPYDRGTHSPSVMTFFSSTIRTLLLCSFCGLPTCCTKPFPTINVQSRCFEPCSPRARIMQAGSNMTAEAADAELSLVEDFLRALIEVVDSLLYRMLPKNPELVYSLLHSQAILMDLGQDENWAASLYNVCTVLRHFNEAVEAAEGSIGAPRAGRAMLSPRPSRGSGGVSLSTRPDTEDIEVGGHDAARAIRHASSLDWSVERVRDIISTHLLTWRPVVLRPVAEVRFAYEEAVGAQEFFMPYLWSILADSPHLAFPRGDVASMLTLAR
jgi:hypothetical protein